MEERLNMEQNITILNRKKATINGVNEVISFDPNEIILDTAEGLLTIQGEELHVINLTVNTGEVQLDGTIIAMIYSPNSQKKKDGGLLSRLFR